MDLTELSKECHAIAVSKGFYDGERGAATDPEISKRLLLIVTEVAEACEAHRNGNFGAGCQPSKDTFPDEMADILIRVFDLCGWLDIDIQKQFDFKMGLNKDREHLHGKNY